MLAFEAMLEAFGWGSGRENYKWGPGVHPADVFVCVFVCVCVCMCWGMGSAPVTKVSLVSAPEHS